MVETEPFYTVSVDFIVGLPTTKAKNGYDQLLVIVDKFTKRVGLLPGASTWTAEQWGIALINYLRQHD